MIFRWTCERPGRALLGGVVMLLAALLISPAAGARVTLVATGMPELALIDVSTREVVGHRVAAGERSR